MVAVRRQLEPLRPAQSASPNKPPALLRTTIPDSFRTAELLEQEHVEGDLCAMGKCRFAARLDLDDFPAEDSISAATDADQIGRCGAQGDARRIHAEASQEKLGIREPKLRLNQKLDGAGITEDARHLFGRDAAHLPIRSPRDPDSITAEAPLEPVQYALFPPPPRRRQQRGAWPRAQSPALAWDRCSTQAHRPPALPGGRRHSAAAARSRSEKTRRRGWP